VLLSALGAAGIAAAGVAALRAGAPWGAADPPQRSSPPAPDPAMLSDDIADGIAVEDRGFAVFPVPDGDEARRIVGAAAVFRNTTDQPMRIHVRYRFVDDTGRGWHSKEQNDWTAVVAAGWAYLPPGRAVELGDVEQVDADQAARVARLALYVIGEPTVPSALLPVTVGGFTRRSGAAEEWDYVSFDVDNPRPVAFDEPNYGMVFRSGDGALIGGWFVDRDNWFDIESALPAGETDRYQPGTSRHTLPAWLPPEIRPNNVTMYLWP
jgi:hypothetical protein